MLFSWLSNFRLGYCSEAALALGQRVHAQEEDLRVGADVMT